MEKIKRELKKMKTIGIYGAIGSGKTALAFSLIDELKKHKAEVYFFNHPKPALIEPLGYKNLDSLERLEEIQDCVLYIDEPQISLPIYAKKANRIIAQICSLSRQLDITLIISTSDTRVFTKANEAFFDCWIIKDLDYDMVKNGSKIKKIMQKNATFDASGLRLNKNEFLFESRNLHNLNGLHSFGLLDYFTEELSKPFRSKTTKTAKQTPQTLTEEKNNGKKETSVTLQTKQIKHEELENARPNQTRRQS